VVRWLFAGALILAVWLVGLAPAQAIPERTPGLDDIEASGPTTLDLASAAMKRDPGAARGHADACQNGDRNACVELGHDYQFGAGVAKNTRRALELYRTGCSQKVQLACVWEGVILLSNSEIGERSRGRQLIDAACKADDPFACYFAGLLAYTGTGMTKDERQAAELFRRGCDAGEPKACSARAYVLDFGKGIKQDSDAAAKLLERTCSNTNEDACDHLGVLNWAGRGVPANHDRARTLFDAACKHGSTRACAHLGASLSFIEAKRKEGRALLELACSKNDAVGCLGIGVWHRLYGDTADAIQPLTRACRKDLGVACRLLGVLYANGHGVSRDDATASELAQRACELDDAHGCSDWALELENHGDVAASIAPLRKACDRDPESGCVELGRLAYLGKGMRKDPPLAVTSWRKACVAGNVTGCSGVALAYVEGVGVPRDVQKGAALYRNACDRNDVNSCVQLAELLSSAGKGIPHDLPESLVLFERGCKAKTADACSHAGHAYDWADGVPENPTTALELYKQGCDLGDGFGCFEAAMYYLRRQKDRKHAAVYLESGCKLKEAESCARLGIEHDDDGVLANDHALAAELCEQGCNGGSAMGCGRLARLLVTGVLGQPDFVRARTLSKRACEGNVADGCHILGVMHRDGRGGPKDPAKAEALFKRECELAPDWCAAHPPALKRPPAH